MIDIIDEYMHRTLKGSEDAVSVVMEIQGVLNGLDLRDDMSAVSALYGICGDLSDIVDGWPIDYDDATEMIAEREIRDAAWDWLGNARSPDGVETYCWTERLANLSTSREDGPSN